MSETTEGVTNPPPVTEDTQAPPQNISKPPEHELKPIEEEDPEAAPQKEESVKEEAKTETKNPTETEIEEELPKDYDNSQSVKTRNTMPQQATTNEQLSKLNNSQESSVSSVG